MIPCVSGKCILSAVTSSRLRPLPATAVLRSRLMNSSCGSVVMVISSFSRRIGRRLGRHLLLDLLEQTRVADLLAPVGLDQPAATRSVLGAPAPRLVIRLRVRDRPELRLLLLADVAAVLAARLELAARRRGDQVRRQSLDRDELS